MGISFVITTILYAFFQLRIPMTRNLLSLGIERVQLGKLENVRSVTLWKRRRRKEQVDGTSNDIRDYASWQGESIYVNTI